MKDVTIYKGYDITIAQDENAESPREWDNIGIIVGYCKSYSLCDVENSFSGKYGTYLKDFYAFINDKYLICTDKWGYIIEELTEKNFITIANWCKKNLAFLPVYLYSHSGITISTSPFSCNWDSGQVGYIYCTKEKAVEELQHKQWRKRALEILEGEIDDFKTYLTGEIYYYEIEKDGKYVNSCYGFYGENDCMDEAKSIIDCEVKNALKKRCRKLKALIKKTVPLEKRLSILQTV